MLAELSAIQAATNSIKAAGDIAKGLMSLKLTADAGAQIIELQRQISAALSDAATAQASQMETLKRIGRLEDELKRFEDWEAQKQKYELRQFTPATLVYALKTEAVQAGEPPHTICPNCYERRRKSVLQWTQDLHQRYRVFVCQAPDCRAQFPMGRQEPAAQPQPSQDYSVYGEE